MAKRKAAKDKFSLPRGVTPIQIDSDSDTSRTVKAESVKAESDSEPIRPIKRPRLQKYDNDLAEQIHQQLLRTTLSPAAPPPPAAQATDPMIIDISSDDLDQKVDVDQEYEDAKEALKGPKRRGRKVGSGKDEKRKSPTEYSKNPNTTKARKRVEKMNQFEREVSRATNAANSWVSKRLGKWLEKWKESKEYQKLSEAERKAKTQEKRAELKKKRYATINAIAPVAPD